MDEAIGWGSIVALSFMTLCIALLDGVSCRWRLDPLEARCSRRSQGPLTVPCRLGPVLPSEIRALQPGQPERITSTSGRLVEVPGSRCGKPERRHAVMRAAGGRRPASATLSRREQGPHASRRGS